MTYLTILSFIIPSKYAFTNVCRFLLLIYGHALKAKDSENFTILTPSPCLPITGSLNCYFSVPQTLLHFGILEYSSELLKTLKEHEAYHAIKSSDTEANADFMIPRGHLLEVEIRYIHSDKSAASIQAVELLLKSIRAHMKVTDTHINAIIIDFYLWDLAKENGKAMNDLPIHLTRSIYY